MEKLRVEFKNGTICEYGDVSYCTVRELEDMTEEGTYEVTGSALYFEREDDEIGKGTIIDMKDVVRYDRIEIEKESSSLEEPER
jgi:hypothetical protein